MNVGVVLDQELACFMVEVGDLVLEASTKTREKLILDAIATPMWCCRSSRLGSEAVDAKTCLENGLISHTQLENTTLGIVASLESTNARIEPYDFERSIVCLVIADALGRCEWC